MPNYAGMVRNITNAESKLLFWIFKYIWSPMPHVNQWTFDITRRPLLYTVQYRYRYIYFTSVGRYWLPVSENLFSDPCTVLCGSGSVSNSSSNWIQIQRLAVPVPVKNETRHIVIKWPIHLSQMLWQISINQKTTTTTKSKILLVLLRLRLRGTG